MLSSTSNGAVPIAPRPSTWNHERTFGRSDGAGRRPVDAPAHRAARLLEGQRVVAHERERHVGVGPVVDRLAHRVAGRERQRLAAGGVLGLPVGGVGDVVVHRQDAELHARLGRGRDEQGRGEEPWRRGGVSRAWRDAAVPAPGRASGKPLVRARHGQAGAPAPARRSAGAPARGTSRTRAGTGARGPPRRAARSSTRGGSAGISRCSRSASANAGAWPAENAPYAASASAARGLPGEHAAQLAPAGDAEVERRPDPLAREREAVAGAVAGEEHAVLDRRAQRVREPVALVADGRHAEPAGDLPRRLLDVVARLVGADADPLLVARRAPTRRSRSGQRAVDPDVEVGVAAARVGMDLEPARDRRLGRLHVRPGAEDAAPAERVDDRAAR